MTITSGYGHVQQSRAIMNPFCKDEAVVREACLYKDGPSVRQSVKSPQQSQQRQRFLPLAIASYS